LTRIYLNCVSMYIKKIFFLYKSKITSKLILFYRVTIIVFWYYYSKYSILQLTYTFDINLTLKQLNGKSKIVQTTNWFIGIRVRLNKQIVTLNIVLLQLTLLNNNRINSYKIKTIFLCSHKLKTIVHSYLSIVLDFYEFH